MLKQYEFDRIKLNFKENNMKGYEEWFRLNVNCKIKTTNNWVNGIMLHSVSKKYAVIELDGFDGIAFRINLNKFIIIKK